MPAKMALVPVGVTRCAQPGMRTGSWTLRPSRPSMSGSLWCSFPPSGCKTTSKRLHWVRAPLQVPPVYHCALLCPPRFGNPAPSLPFPLEARESSVVVVGILVVLTNAVVCTARSGCVASTARIYQDEVPAGDVPSGHGGQVASQAHPGPPTDVRAGPAVEEVRAYQGRHWRGGPWARYGVYV